MCYWCQDFVSEEEASHKIANCPYQSTARSDWWKARMDKKSTHSTDPEGKAEVVEMVEVEEVSDLGQVKSCAIGVKILFLKRKLVTK